MDVGGWLRGLGLERYEQAFREADVGVDVLPDLIDADLKELGVSLGDRKRLLKAAAALRPAAAEAVAAGSIPVEEPPSERRQVAVLFADLAGYTALARELDAEELHDLLEGFFAVADRLIEEHGGTIDKHIGDCVMGVFGAPVAHGNDAERAVRAALAVRDAMPTLSARTARPVAVHIGVASGQVVASGTGGPGHRTYTVTGDSVNLASRLTDLATPGEILVSNAVRRALAERLECDDAGALEVKGFAEPVRAWRLLGLCASTGLAPRVLVGRQGELRQFEAALAACEASGRGQALYVRGEAGIGKTRLVEEVTRLAAERGFACHLGLVLDFGAGTGRDAIRSLVRSILGVAAGAEAAAVEAAARALGAGLVAEEDTVFLNDLLDLPQTTELRALYDAMDNAARNRGKRRTVARLVERASRERPLLLVVEDLHWADELILAHLARLAATVAECPALLVMTSRAEGNPLGRRVARAARRRPTDHDRPRAAAAGRGARPRRDDPAGQRGLRRALRGAGGGQPAVPGAAAAPCRGERRGRRARFGAEPGAGASRPARARGQAGPPGGLRARAALRAGRSAATCSAERTTTRRASCGSS